MIFFFFFTACVFFHLIEMSEEISFVRSTTEERKIGDRPIAQFFTIMRDETQNLHIWADYYSQIAGYEQLHILNHSSMSKRTITILSELQERGVNVYKADIPFEKKSEALTNIIQAAKNRSEWLIPLDLDEYMVTANFSELQTVRDVTGAVRNALYELAKMPDSQNIRVPWYLSLPRDCIEERNVGVNDPYVDVCSSTAFYELRRFGMDKIFSRSEQFVATTQGNHKVYSKCKSFGSEVGCDKEADLYFLHFRVRSFYHFLVKSYERTVISYNKPYACHKGFKGKLGSGGYCTQEDLELAKDQFRATYCTFENKTLVDFSVFSNHYCDRKKYLANAALPVETTPSPSIETTPSQRKQRKRRKKHHSPRPEQESE